MTSRLVIVLLRPTGQKPAETAPGRQLSSGSGAFTCWPCDLGKTPQPPVSLAQRGLKSTTSSVRRKDFMRCGRCAQLVAQGEGARPCVAHLGLASALCSVRQGWYWARNQGAMGGASLSELLLSQRFPGCGAAPVPASLASLDTECFFAPLVVSPARIPARGTGQVGWLALCHWWADTVP